MCWFFLAGTNALHFFPSPISKKRAHIVHTMRLSVLLCAAGLTAVSAFAPISSQAGVSTSSLFAFDEDSTVGTFDPLNLASDGEETSNNGINGMGLAAATTAAWVASSDVASAAGPDWGIFEGVSFPCCRKMSKQMKFSFVTHAVQLQCSMYHCFCITKYLKHHMLSNYSHSLL